jgi:Cu2+-exporting ATPase
VQSEHPIGKGITDKAEEMDIELKNVNNFQAVKGKGVTGTVDGEKAEVMSRGYLDEKGIDPPEGAEERGGATLAYVLKNDQVLGTIILEDSIRPESYTAVEELHKRDIKCWMLTGDNEETAKAVAEELGMDGYFAGILPDEKQEKIKELQEQGEYVAMTGDGVNDAPALAQAEVGIAVGSGTDVAASTADIVLVNSNPVDITALILFGKATYKKMVQNLIWATAYNIIAIPLAAGVLAGVGIILSPAVGAILMSASTVIVAINARLLRMPQVSASLSGPSKFR